jgi:hypothetical protein
MMRVFIVHAHPEPKSFNAAMTHAATAALSASGHSVRVSDLYAMGFTPVSGRRNFTTCLDPDYSRRQGLRGADTACTGLSLEPVLVALCEWGRQHTFEMSDAESVADCTSSRPTRSAGTGPTTQ